MTASEALSDNYVTSHPEQLLVPRWAASLPRTLPKPKLQGVDDFDPEKPWVGWREEKAGCFFNKGMDTGEGPLDHQPHPRHLHHRTYQTPEMDPKAGQLTGPTSADSAGTSTPSQIHDHRPG